MKFIRLRITLSKWLFGISIKIVPKPEDTPAYKLLPDELKIPQDAAIEADDLLEQWQPEQHGNVVIVEPDLMFRYRRGKL